MVVVVVTGRVAQFNVSRGFGFIASDEGGEDVFVHSGELGSQAGRLKVGMRVQFQVMGGQRGLKAYEVKILDEGGGSDHSSSPDVDHDDDEFEAMSAREYGTEITDTLIAHCPGMTASQIVAVRTRLVGLAEGRGWLDD